MLPFHFLIFRTKSCVILVLRFNLQRLFNFQRLSGIVGRIKTSDGLLTIQELVRLQIIGVEILVSSE